MKQKNKKIPFFYGLGDKPSQYKLLSRFIDVIKVDWNNPEKVRMLKNNTVIGFSMGCF